TDAVLTVATAQVDDRPIAITGSDDHTVRVWDLTTGRTTATLTGHTDAVLTVATAQVDDRPIAITGSDDHTVRVWDLAAASCLTAVHLPNSPGCATIGPDSTAVLGMGYEVIALTLGPIFRREP
ncbi:hypothetical protein ABZ706_30040, partial [Streptomyces albidoflavus]